MKNKLKFRKRSRSQILSKVPPVLIVKPHAKTNLTCEETSQWKARQWKHGIANYTSQASATPDIARNTGIRDFLTLERHRRQKYIFFLDDDSPPFEDNAIIKLMEMDVPFAAGVTPIRIYRDGVVDENTGEEGPKYIDMLWNPVFMQTNGEKKNFGPDELPTSIFKAHTIGGTCLLIKREVFEALEPPYQKFTFNKEHTKCIQGEDIYFSNKVREAGFTLWVNPDVKCHHYHRMDIADWFMMIEQSIEIGKRMAR